MPPLRSLCIIDFRPGMGSPFPGPAPPLGHRSVPCHRRRWAQYRPVRREVPVDQRSVPRARRRVPYHGRYGTARLADGTTWPGSVTRRPYVRYQPPIRSVPPCQRPVPWHADPRYRSGRLEVPVLSDMRYQPRQSRGTKPPYYPFWCRPRRAATLPPARGAPGSSVAEIARYPLRRAGRPPSRAGARRPKGRPGARSPRRPGTVWVSWSAGFSLPRGPGVRIVNPRAAASPRGEP